MIEIDLSTLGQAELRRLSKAARVRGDGLLADRVDWEIATRLDHGLGHDLPAFAPLPIDPGAGPGRFEADDEDEDEEPPAFRPHHDEAPEAARSGWRSMGLVILGAVVGSLATAGGFWAESAFGAREPAPRVDVVQSAPPPVAELASQELAVPAPVMVAQPVAQPAEAHPPKAARAVRRVAKARPAPVEDPDRLARQYESRVRDLDAARAREDEPIY